MLFKLTIQIILFIIALFVDAYQIERYLLGLKKHKKQFELKRKYLLWGFIQKTRISSVVGFSFIPIMIQLVNPYWGEPMFFFPLALSAILFMWIFGNAIHYLLFKYYLRKMW